MKLAYEAFDKTGQKVSDVIEAADIAEATEDLRKQDLFVADITPVRGDSGPRKRRTRGGATDAAAVGIQSGSEDKARVSGSKTRRLKTLSMFTRQLYVLVSTGTTLAQALSALERQIKDPGWRNAVGDVRMGLEEGCSLSEAMSSHSECFDSVYRHMIAAGESGGELTGMLERLADLTHKRLHIRAAIQGAMVYPCLLTVVALSVLVLLMVFVIPRFGELFDSLDTAQPPSTAILLAASEITVKYWWAMISGFVAVIVGLRTYFKSPHGRRVFDTLVLNIPKIGGIVRNFSTARIIRMLGVLLESRVPVLEALALTGDTTSNSHYTELMKRAERAVSQGQEISAVFAETDLITPAVYEATRSGEKSGQVGPLLLNLAEFLDEENEVTLKALTSIIEPVILIIMGLLVGFVALSMFMPLFDVTSMTGGG
ncbi:MAG: type II secretion system F family protein [Phycisphaerae bacterium]|jgi:type II secretory pathway component PulF|nr:type II secretion system F family protein [Phycisphaerae bacterium]